MRVQAISTHQFANYKKTNNVKQEYCSPIKSFQTNSKEQVAFKGFLGKITGGALGAGFAGLCALATMATPVGWVAAAALLTAEAGGAVIGGAIGDKISGKDEEEQDKE